MTAVTRKVAMLGLWGVGKTSLVRRFVTNVFDERYQSTIGVKVDNKEVEVGDRSVKMVLWDIAGAEDERAVPVHYVAGAAGYLLVLDGTRRESLEAALDLVASVEAGVGKLPFVPVINKSDLDWEIDADEVAAAFAAWDCTPLSSSARTGENVENAFLQLAARL